jgi:pimeloyl-ACP methyl ester carboxylesterase
VSGAIVVGHSLGGPIAARLALDRPALARGLALVAPSIDPELEGRRWFNVAGSWRVVQWFLPVDWTTSNREIWWLRRELELLAPGLESLAAPTIVIQGGRDDLVDPANADYVERRFRSAPLEIRRLPDAGHFVVWEDPAPIRRAIEELLERPL